MKKLVVSWAAIAACIGGGIAPVAAQDGSSSFTRTGSWTLDFADDGCQISRPFTNGSDEVSLALERNRAENLVRLILVGNAIRPFRGADGIGYRFMPVNDQRSAPYVRAETADGRAYFNLGTVILGSNPFAAPAGGGPAAGPPVPPPAAAPGAGPGAFVAPPYDRNAELEFAEAVTAIELNQGLTRTIRLETGSLRGVLEALQICTDDLLASWGLDAEKHQTMSRRAAPAGPAFEWIPANVVGFQDFAAFSGARNPFRVMVGADGKPTGCQAHWASLDAAKNEQICSGIMQNGNFHPALDAAGQPMASYWMVDYIFGLSRPFGG